MIKVTQAFNQSDYLTYIFTLAVGEVFEFVETSQFQFEDLLERLKEFIPETLKTFKIEYISPGSELFTHYGMNKVVIIEKTANS